MHIHKITVEITDQHNITFKAFHDLLNHKSPGLRTIDDFVVNPHSSGGGFYITGLTPKAAEAIGRIAFSYNLNLIRFDVAYTAPVTDQVAARADYLDYHYQTARLKKHLLDKKYPGGHEEYTHFSIRHFVYGAQKSIKQLVLTDHTDPPAQVEALQIVWRLRQQWALEAWQWVLKSDDFSKGVDYAFCAATNTFLGPDWFQLGHSDHPKLERQAKPIVKKVEAWQDLIDRAFDIARKEPGQVEPFDTATMISDYLFRQHVDEVA